MKFIEELIGFIRDYYATPGSIYLHEPVIDSLDIENVVNCLESGFVSSVGHHIDEFERMLCEFTGAKNCVSLVNGSAALHIALLISGVERGDLVLTPSVSFIATSRAIRTAGADPIFIDVDEHNAGMCPTQLSSFLENETYIDSNYNCVDKVSGRRIKAILPVHVFGQPCSIVEIRQTAKNFNLSVVEDAAEALGSKLNEKDIISEATISVCSFNGNKIITTGGGGAVFTDDCELALRAKHITTTSKQAHKYEYIHDQIGFNYRLPSLNASLGISQVRKLPIYLAKKRDLANRYRDFFQSHQKQLFGCQENSESNNWLNSFRAETQEEKNVILDTLHDNHVFARPLWKPIHLQKEFQGDRKFGEMRNTIKLYETIVCLPSGIPHT